MSRRRDSDGVGTTRDECLRSVVRLVGEAGVAAFLKGTQPALGDRSGAWLLQYEPAELLRRLTLLEVDTEPLENAADFDPCMLDRPPGRRKEGEISRLDAIFNELGREGA